MRLLPSEGAMTDIDDADDDCDDPTPIYLPDLNGGAMIIQLQLLVCTGLLYIVLLPKLHQL